MTVPKIKQKKLFITLGIIVLLILSIISSYFIIIKIGENKLRDSLSNLDNISASNAYGDEADAYYNGQAYYYNKNLINILCIGVDRNNIESKSGKQADVIYLISFDSKTKKANVISIPRNTLTDIEIYDMNGEFLDTEYKQICLSYAFGNDHKHSSELITKAVSRLLFDININGYYTIFMNSVAEIVDSVGGVNVTVPEDLTDSNLKWKKNANITLNGDNVLEYLTYRKDSSYDRTVRQREFVTSFLSQAKKATAKNLSLPINMYNKLANNTVTNVDATSAVYLASEVVKTEFNVLQISGKVGFDGTFETFEVDQDSLYQTVLDVFYKIKK